MCKLLWYNSIVVITLYGLWSVVSEFDERNQCMKRIIIAVLGIIFAFVLFWIGSISMCEYNTYKYGEIFRSIKIHDIGGEGYLDDCDIKVIKYNKDYAKVYAVFSYEQNETGLVYYFEKNENDDWKFDYYEAVYSKMGSADGFIWPYIR